MVGSIDPRCETLRGTHWPVKVAVMFGTRVAENHLGQRSTTASTGRTYGCKRSDQTFKKLLRHGGRPHMDASDPIRPSKNSCGTGAVHIWMQAIRSDLQKTLAARGPSTYGSLRSQGRPAERSCEATTVATHG